MADLLISGLKAQFLIYTRALSAAEITRDFEETCSIIGA